MSADYRVDLTIGPTLDGTTYAWSVNRGDAPVLPEVLDGLTVGWQFPESTIWPVQPEAVSLAFSLLAADAADLAKIDRGTPVKARIWAGVTLGGTDYDSVTFVGKVTDLGGKPIVFGHPASGDEVDGWQLDVIAVDPVAQLGEYTFATPNGNSGLNVYGEMRYLFGLAITGPAYQYGVDPDPFDWGDGGDAAGAAPVDFVQATDLLTGADFYLTSYADGGPTTNDHDRSSYTLYDAQGWRRGIIRPNVDGAGNIDPDQPWRFEWISRRYGAQPGIGPALPGVFANLGGGVYGVRLEAPPASVVIGGTPTNIYDASIVIDADYLDFGATWTRSKFDDPNTVDVAAGQSAADPTNPEGAWTKVSATNALPGEAIVSAQITDCPLSAYETAQFVAEMYLDDSANADTIWAASGFRWYASQDPAWPINRSLFPDTELFGEYGAPVVIKGIPAAQRPDGKPWYVGVPRSVQWTFSRGEFEISFDLYPRVPKPINSGAIGLTWAECGTEFPAVTWNNLDPSQTWLDARLARSAVYYP